MRRVTLALVCLGGLLAAPSWGASESDYFITGAPTGGGGPAAFETFRRCEAGSKDGQVCSVDGDCTGGGLCVTASYPVCVYQTRPNVVRRTEQRTTTGTAVDAFSTAAAPCDQVRIVAWETNAGPLYVGFSGVTTSSGVRLPAGGSIAMPSSGGDCNSVKVLCATADTGCTAGYKFSVVTP